MNSIPDCRRGWKADGAAGFTLVELLVVILVIAVLSALLLPALARGKSSARAVQCMSQLHQLGLAAHLYLDDNGGLLFRYRGAYTNGGDVYWFGWLERGSEGTRAFDATHGALYPYLQGLGVELCPSLTYSSARFKAKAVGAAYGYGVNLHLTLLPVNIASVHRPSDIIFLADAAQVNDFQPPASKTHPMLEEFYYVSANANEKTAHFRHQKRANALFCDGHVSRESPLAGSFDTRLPEEHVGRLKPEALLP